MILDFNAKLIAAISFVIGVVYLISVPPMQVPDEQNHFFRSYQISEGVLTPTKMGKLPNYRGKEHAGGDLPVAVTQLNDIFDPIRFRPENKVAISHFNQAWQIKIDRDQRENVPFSNTALFSFVMYSIPAAAIEITSWVSSRALVQFYAARIACLLFSILCLWMACKIFPHGQLIFLFVTILPMNIHQLAAISSDSYTNSICLLFSALVLKLCSQRDKINNKEVLALLFVGVLVASSKQIAAPLLGIVILIPMTKFGSLKKYSLYMIGFYTVMVLVLLFWALKAKEVHVPLYWHPGSNAESQIKHMQMPKYVKPHFDVFVKDLKLKSFYYLKMAIGLKLGYVDTILKDWLINFYLATILILILFYGRINSISKKQALGFIGIFFVGVITIEVAIYINTSPIGATYNDHVHGRYFLAYFFVLFAALTRLFSFKINLSKYLSLIVTVFCIVGTLASIWTVINRYYVI
ncbi:MAG: DUF2142 domain-containing protein [Gammaproteobacteria bacterium]|nr:DUF2142 domain-containing protein [Gammaproteobacteria bacterium]